jgi:DNA mismatch endonuclease (patch repair protein)
MDNLTAEQRRKNMQAIKCKDTSIECILRKELWARGFRYRKNYKKLIGKPDIVMTKYKLVIFCDSEFWHGKNYHESTDRIGTNSDYWKQKIKRNIERDKEVNEKLIADGWTVLRFWEKEIRKELDKCIEQVVSAIESSGK